MAGSWSAWLLAILCSTTQAQFDQMPKKPKPAPLKADLKYIKCAVCEKMVAEALRQMEDLSSTSAVEDMLERVCDADADGKEGRGKEGSWMSELDVSKKGQQLLVEHKGPGHCRRECRTVAKACDSVVEKLENDELAEVLLNGARAQTSTGMIAQRVCVQMAGVCKKGKVPLWPEGKVRQNEVFKPKEKKDSDIDDLLASMGGMGGMGGLTTMSASDMDLGIVDEIDQLRDEL